MSFPSPEVEELRLKTRLEGAIKHAADINERALEVYAEVAKEKTHYFEKIAPRKWRYDCATRLLRGFTRKQVATCLALTVCAHRARACDGRRDV